MRTSARVARARSPKAPEPMKAKYLILLICGALIIALDQLTKHLVVQKFALGDSVPILDGYFNLTYIRNPGAAFGLLRDAPPAFRIPFFITIPFVALAA